MSLADQFDSPDTFHSMFSAKPTRTALILLGALCGFGLLILYGVIPYTYSHLMHLTSVFGALWAMWMIFPDFQHGMIVPVLAGVIVFLQRKKLSELPVMGWGPGVVFVALSLALYWAGRRVDNQYIGFFSIQALLASLVLWLLGWRWLFALAFPLTFLVFTWPMPFLDAYVTFPLRMLMSNMSTATLNFFGLPVIQNGTGILSAPNPELGFPAGKLFQVDVANPCSGIRSLFALMMVSAIYGFFALKSPWKRGLLFLCSIPLAVAGNLARILILTLGIITIGAPTAIGSFENPSWFHTGAGYVVFLVALSGMLIISRLLNSTSEEWLRKWRTLRSEVGRTAPPKTGSHNASEDLY